MKSKNEFKLSQRQQEILQIIFKLEKASVTDIMKNLSNAPSDGAVRRMLNILYQKNAVDYYSEGTKKIYYSKIDAMLARRQALNRIVEAFFEGSSTLAIASLLQDNKQGLSSNESEVLLNLIKKAKKSGR